MAFMNEELIIDADDSNFEKILLESELPVLVDFWAPSCAPCRIQSLVIEDAARRYKGKVLFVKVNLDTAREVSRNLKIRNVPTIVIFKNMEISDVWVGVTNQKTLARMLDRALGKSLWQRWFGKKT